MAPTSQATLPHGRHALAGWDPPARLRAAQPLSEIGGASSHCLTLTL